MVAVDRLVRRGGPADRFDILEMWATLLALPAGLAAAALPVHLAVSAAIAVLYALGFGLAGAVDSGWAWGLIGGIVHWIVAGTFLGTVPARDDGSMDTPGPFAMRTGSAGALSFLAGHLLFGLVVGIAYFAFHPGVIVGAASQ